MCNECGCANHEGKDVKTIRIDKHVTETNDIIARQVSHNLRNRGILCVNVMGAPGSGKTTLIEGISKFIKPSRIAVIQGDLESDLDKKRLENLNIGTCQINTHSGCHLNAALVNAALINLDLAGKEFLIIENVGNLVCPANVKISQHANIVVSSVAEGSDKPKKYPYIFMDANWVVISKTDLAGMVDFDEKRYMGDISHINPKAKFARVSSKDAKSYYKIAELLEHERQHLICEKHGHKV